MKPGLSLSPFIKHWRALAFGAGLVFLGTAVTAASNYPPIGWSQVDGGMTVGGTGIYPYACTLNSDNTTCTLNTTGGGGSGAPLTGGASGVATAANQSVGLAAFNGTTMDALDDTSNALNVYVTNPAGGYSYTQGQTGVTGSFLGSACAYYSSAPTLTNSQVNPLSCDTGGALLTASALSTTSTLSNVSASTSTVTILAANTARRDAYIFNDSTATMYLAFASTASTTAYTLQLQSYQGYEFNNAVYTGALSAVWSSATGTARVTQITP